MLAAERRDALLEKLRTDGKVVAKDVSRELGISEDSVRRDLRELASLGLCQRVYGGALPASPAVADYAARTTLGVSSKERVARRAVAMIPRGATVILDGGTTTLAMTSAMPRDLAITVVTHSPTVAAALIDHPAVEIYLIGGRVFKHSAVTSGAAAAEAAERIQADLFFLGVTGVHATAGLTTDDADEAAMKRLLARRAADTYVLASSEKMGAASRFAVLPFAHTAGVITDADETHPAVWDLRAAGVPVVDAP